MVCCAYVTNCYPENKERPQLKGSTMDQVITFEQKDKIWDKSKFGHLVRTAAFYKLYPYLFAFHDEGKFQIASEYANYNAFNYYSSLFEESAYTKEEHEFLCYLAENANPNKPYFRKNGRIEIESPNSYYLLLNSPNRPAFFCVIGENKYNNQKKSQSNAGIAPKDRMIDDFQSCDSSALLNQHDIVTEFCEVGRLLYKAQTTQSQEWKENEFTTGITKTLVRNIMLDRDKGQRFNSEDLERYTNHFAPIAPLIYGATRCVEFGYEMRESFVNNLEIIIAKQFEIRDIVVNKIFTRGNEKFYKEDIVFILDLPVPSINTPQPRTSELKKIIDDTKDSLKNRETKASVDAHNARNKRRG